MTAWVFALTQFASAELKPESVHTADSKKNLAYIRDGLVVGGDRAITGVIVKDIRRAVNPGYERIVIDLEGTQNGEPAAIDRPPYYQVAINPDEKRLIITLWGRPKLELDPRKVSAAFRKSAAVSAVQLLPKVEDETWTFVFDLKGSSPIEVFELANPVRVIVDVKVQKSVATHSEIAKPKRGSRTISKPVQHTELDDPEAQPE